MEIVERIKTEVERLRDVKGISFREMVCYADVLRIIDREISHKPLEGGQWGNPISEPQYKIDYNFINKGFDKDLIKGDTNEW